MQMQMLARGYLVYEMTGSPSLLGAVTAVAAVPGLAFGLYGGVLADRVDKKRIIQAAQGLSLVVALLIAVAITTNTITWQHLLVASLVQGSAMPLMLPARQAIIPQLVGRERIMNAVALATMVMSITTLLGPALAGAMIDATGIATTYYIMAGMYLGAMVLTGYVPTIAQRQTKERSSVLGDLLAGFQYIRHNRILLLLLLISFSTMVFAMPIRLVLPIFAKDIFDVGANGLGLLMSMLGIGGLGGALIVASLGKIARRGTLLLSAGVFTGITLVVFAFLSYAAPIFVVALVALIAAGLVQAARMSLNLGLMTEYAQDEYRGRVMSFFSLNAALVPAGVLPITLMTERLGAPASVGIMAMVPIVVGGIILIASPAMRSLK